MSRVINLINKLVKRQLCLIQEPNRGQPTAQGLSIPPKTFPNMPNLQGIGGIPGLQNIDFSNLPMGMDFSNFDPRAINANPQGFQDMIEQAQAQEGRVTSLPVLGNTPRGPGMNR